MEKKLNIKNFTIVELSAILLTTKLAFDREDWLMQGAEVVKAKCMKIVEEKFEGYENEEQKGYIANNIALFCIGQPNIFDQYFEK